MCLHLLIDKAFFVTFTFNAFSSAASSIVDRCANNYNLKESLFLKLKITSTSEFCYHSTVFTSSINKMVLSENPVVVLTYYVLDLLTCDATYLVDKVVLDMP